MQANPNANAKQQKVLAQITSLAKEEGGIDVCWLYGSRARGQASEASDYDLAIAINANSATAASKEQEYYADDLAYRWRQKLGCDISIVDIIKAPTPLAYTIIEDRTVLYCENSLRLHSEEQRIWSKWEAYEWEYERNRKAT